MMHSIENIRQDHRQSSQSEYVGTSRQSSTTSPRGVLIFRTPETRGDSDAVPVTETTYFDALPELHFAPDSLRADANVPESVFRDLELFPEERNDRFRWDCVATIVNVIAEVLGLSQGFVLRFVDVEVVALVFSMRIPVSRAAVS